ncbi:MAG: tetratricopeptide repeat protein [Marinifilaceae bacterium]
MKIDNNISLFYISQSGKGPDTCQYTTNVKEIVNVADGTTQQAWMELLHKAAHNTIAIVDVDRMHSISARKVIESHLTQNNRNVISYVGTSPEGKGAKFFFTNGWKTDSEITASPMFIIDRRRAMKAFYGAELADNAVCAMGYSLQKSCYRYNRVEQLNNGKGCETPTNLWKRYTIDIPVTSAKILFKPSEWKSLSFGHYNALTRSLMYLFAIFAFIYMPFISADYGISGDEFVDMRHCGYVLDYFANGDKTALDQPKTALHLYGNGTQVIAEIVSRTFGADDPFIVRHALNALVGALGVLITGLLAMRLGGGVAGLLGVLLMFFTPRYFGHAMNNMKDLSFAVGYIMAIYYFIRTQDNYPRLKFRYVCGAAIGIFLAMGTRSGGLMLYPYFFFIAGLYYLEQVGWKDCLKLYKNRFIISNYLALIVPILLVGYIASIALWPYGIEQPFTGMVKSLKQFTNYNVGLRTIFDGEQMMSTMLPWRYAPQYLMISTPIITLIGLFAMAVWSCVRLVTKRRFSPIMVFLFFAVIFPVFWVIYQKSNLYGGIRHLLFVVPIMVCLAAVLWSKLVTAKTKAVRIVAIVVLVGGFTLPVKHMVANHPNDYVYFNELVGNLSGAYGDYETDYYYNSLYNSSEWFKKNVLSGSDSSVIIATNHAEIMKHYFRKYPNVRIKYARFYDKYAADWDYAIYGNVYINSFQLKQGLFPPVNCMYSPNVDGLPMSVVFKRNGKSELLALEAIKAEQPQRAIPLLKTAIDKNPQAEELWSKLGNAYRLSNYPDSALHSYEEAIALHPYLNEPLYFISNLYKDMGQYDKALRAANKILEENQYAVMAYISKMNTYMAMEKDKEAINAANAVLRIDPKNQAAHDIAGNILFKHQNYDQALDLYNKLMQMTNNIVYATKVADCLCRMGRPKECEALLENIYKAKIDFAPAQRVSARLALTQGKMDKADSLLKDMDNNDTDVLILKAISAAKRKDKVTARTFAQEVLNKNSKHREAIGLLKELQ